MQVASALVWSLGAWGAKYIFGVSGANIEHLHDAVVRSQGGVVSILAKSEVGAAFMADARARSRRTLGVCCATSGGGMMNLAVGIAESHAEHVPVLAIVGQVPQALEGRGGFQDSSARGRTVDAFGLFRSISKFTARIEGADVFWRTLVDAVREALSGVQGPSVLLIPRNVFELEAGPPPADFPMTFDELVSRPRLSATAVHALMDELRRAKRPVIVVGRDAETAAGKALLVELATRARIPVAATMAAPTAFPNGEEMYLGCVGAAGHPSAHAYLNQSADLIVALGTDLPIMTRGPFAKGLERATVAAVGLNVDQAAANLGPNLIVEGDPEEVLRAMLGAYSLRPFVHDYDAVPLRRYVAELADGPTPNARLTDSLRQGEALALLEPYMPRNGHILFDAGNCAAASIHYMGFPRDSRGLIALGMAGMGYAIAAAVGAQLGAEPSERSVVLAGDGAFLILGFEVHTAVELDLPILFVVFNNGKHGMCVTRQNIYFEGRRDCAEYTPVDVSMIAAGVGGGRRLWTGRARTTAELREALASFHRDPGRPGVLELVLEREEIPPFAPFLRADAATYEVSKSLPSSVNCAA